jgi:hypothetical protein
MLHVNIDALMDAMILERADQFQAGAVPDVGEPRIAMAAEIALKNPPVSRAIKHRTPGFQLPDALGRLLRVQFDHPPVIDWPPRIVSAKCTFQLSFVTFARAAAMPPSAITVCAFPRRDLQIRPTLTPAAEASMAARRPAPPAPMMSTSYSRVS